MRQDGEKNSEVSHRNCRIHGEILKRIVKVGTQSRLTFFQMGTEAFSTSMAYCTPSRASLRWGDEMAMMTLDSATGTSLESEK